MNVRRLPGSVIVMLLCATSAPAAPRFTITDLGTVLGGTESSAVAINDAGEIVGSSTVGGNSHVYRYVNGQMTDLGTFGRPSAEAVDINEPGQILVRTGSSPSTPYVLYDHGQQTQLPIYQGRNVTWRDLNDNGQVVGLAFPPNSQARAVRYTVGQGVVQDIGTLGGPSAQPQALNNSGDVVGVSSIGSQQHGFVYRNGQMTDLGTLPGGTVSSAFVINEGGTIAGYATKVGSSFPQRLVLFNGGGQVTELGILPGGESMIAQEINEQNHIVGYVGFPGFTGKTRAFGYVDNTLAYLDDLIDPALGWQLTRADSINEAGQIVGTGINALGQTRGFLLDPIVAPPPPPTAAPLPAAVWSGLIGAGVMVAGRVKRGLRSCDRIRGGALVA